MEDNKSEKEKIQKIKSIIAKEIEKELVNKQNEVSDISEKIKTVLRNLELLKYVIAVSYYDQNPVLTSKKGQDESNEDEKSQLQIHPCVKKLLPFRTNYEKSLESSLNYHLYETRQSKKELAINDKTINSKGEICKESASQSVSTSIIPKIPHYVPPLPKGEDSVESVNSTGGDVSKERFRIVVGNVSKWIPPDTREDSSTHKWMIYIRNKDGEKDVAKHLKKVRYFLHESYKPHDIIDVTAPFQLTRRGWGEFPIRVQLHFNHPLNKPVDIIHNLKLDMTCSGVQMLGRETVVDICLHVGDASKSIKRSENAFEKKKYEEEEVRTREKQDVFDGNLLMNCNEMDDGEESHAKAKADEGESGKTNEAREFLRRKIEEMQSAICCSRKFLLDRRKAIKIIEIEHDYLKGKNVESDDSLGDLTKSLLKIDSGKSGREEKLFYKNGVIVQSGHHLARTVLHRKEQLCRLNISAHQSEEDMFKKLKNAVKEVEKDVQSKYYFTVFRHAYFVNLLQRAQATKLKTVEALVRWIVQRWPILTNLSADFSYKTIHPYSCSSEAEFFRYSVGKQRSAEWFRAKAIQKVLKSLKSVVPIEEEIWTAKQIFLWCRFHGYVPISSSSLLSSSASATPSSSAVQVKREPLDEREERLSESSSDSEYGSDRKVYKTGTNRYLNGTSVCKKKKNFKKSRKKMAKEEDSGWRVVSYKECNTFTEEKLDLSRFGVGEFRSLDSPSDIIVDVVEVEKNTPSESPTKRREGEILIETIPPSQSIFNKFVCETARQIGVKIQDEEIIPGVKCDSVSRALSQSVYCFVEELLRRSLARAWIRNGERCPESVDTNDILGTLIEHPNFDIFTNRGLGQEKPSTSSG